ncbi:MAG: outer membrane protein assembly factor BamD [Gammaproteobacteria bacterium]|nr:outer membrane protein assembly factor BamD [Gammaproteobacteria bacterium]
MRISVIFLFSLMLLVGCASTPETEVSEKQQLTDAMTSLREGKPEQSIAQFQAIIDKAESEQQKTQAEIGLAYAYYTNDDFEEAYERCNRFIEDNPTHPQLDYVYYLRGLTKLKQGEIHLQRLLTAKAPTDDYPGELREAYDYFSALINFFPQSSYLDQTYQQVDTIRQRLAKYELHLAHNQLALGNLKEAAHHAEYVNKYYSDTLSRKYALTIMVRAYKELDMPQQLNAAERQLRELTYQQE